MTAPPPPEHGPPPPYHQPPPPWGGQAGTTPFWGPVLAGAVVTLLVLALPLCGSLACCCGLPAVPGAVVAVALRARRDHTLRILDGAVTGFLSGAIAGAGRLLLVLGGLLRPVLDDEGQENLRKMMAEMLAREDLSAEERRLRLEFGEALMDFMARYGDWLVAVVLAAAGAVVGLVAASILSGRFRPQPPPAHPSQGSPGAWGPSPPGTPGS